jgi:hypothetical protein
MIIRASLEGKIPERIGGDKISFLFNFQFCGFQNSPKSYPVEMEV